MKAAGGSTTDYVADWIGEVLDDLSAQIDQDIVVETTIDPTCRRRGKPRIARRSRRTSGKFDVSAGRAGGDDPGWRGARWSAAATMREPVQPRRRRPAPAGFGVQAVRLSHRARGRADAGEIVQDRRSVRQGMEAGKLHARISRPGDADDRRWRCRSTRSSVRLAAKSGRRPWCATAHRLGIVVEARRQRLDRARHLRGLAHRTGRRLCRRSPMAARASPRMS